MHIELVKTADILKELGNRKHDNQILVGFALESVNPLEYGIKKMMDKRCDMMIINQANQPDSGFGGDKNTITILDQTMQSTNLPTMTKQECAEEIFNHLLRMST